MHAQLLGLLLFSTAASLQRLASAFGGGEEEWGGEEPSEAPLLPGPHAALRCLFRLDPGKTRACSSCPAQKVTFRAEATF